MILDVIDGGLLTTVQDAGRPGWTHLGVPVSGAADPWGLAVANLLAGNEPDAAALEMTIVGPTLVVRVGGTIALAGADLGARAGGRPLVPGRSQAIATGETITIPGADRPAGARGYLAIPGGVDVPRVLGSRSTCLAAGFGGLDGRPLRAGDELRSDRASGDGPDGPDLVWPEADPAAESGGGAVLERVLRVLPGPADGLDDLVAGPWRVAAAANRVGVRLEGRTLEAGIGGETATQGVSWGAIQVPPDGRPIVLSADHQTTGGYGVVAVVIAADRPILGQLQPGDPVRLVATDPETALLALRERRDRLVAGAVALRDAAGWDRLTRSAGG